MKNLIYIGVGVLLLGILIINPNDTFRFGAIASLEDIEVAQEVYLQKNGSYLQTLENNQLPSDKTGTVKTLLGIDLPANYKIDVYGNQKGQGYQIRWETATSFNSIGYGIEASERTFTIAKPQFVASSTP